MIVILFGLSGVGKTYIGDIIAKHFNYHHEDADKWLTDEMKLCIETKKSFTTGMLAEFTQIMIKNIEDLSKIYPKLVISQGLYRRKNRDEIKEHFFCDQLMFIEVRASYKTIAKRIAKRANLVSPGYALVIEKFFEPMEDAHIIDNDQAGEESIITKLQKILS